MAVSIPRLNQFESSTALPKNDRININVQDQGSEILQRTSQVAAIGDKIGDIYQKYENDTIDNLAAENEQRYNNWSKTELEKLKQYEGDPTDAYADFDNRAKEKYNEIVSSRPDVSERVRRHVTSRFDKVTKNHADASLFQRGMQKEVYDNKLFESSVKLKKDDLTNRSGYIRKDDSSSFFKFDEGLNDIKNTITKRALKKGGATQLPDDAEKFDHAYTDDDGKIVKVKWNDNTKQRLAKETSEGVKTAIDVQIASGQLENAQAMRERYKGQLDPLNAAKLDTKIGKSGVRKEADSFLMDIKGKPLEDQIQAIEKLPESKLKSEIIKIKEVDDSRLQRMRERKDKTNRDVLLKEIGRLEDDGQPMLGVADLENNPVFKNVDFDSLDVKSQKAIREAVKQPKESSDKSLARVNNLLLGDSEVDVANLSFEDFQSDYLTGLSKSDRNRYINEYKKMKNPSATAERGTYKRANQILKDQLLLSGFIKKDSSGSLSGRNEKKLLQAQDELLNYLSDQGGNFNEEQLRKVSKDLAASRINDTVFNPEPIKSPRPSVNQQTVTPTSQTVTPTGATTDQVLEGLQPLQVTELMREFKKQNNGQLVLRKDPRFLKFVRDNKQRVLNG